MKRGCEIEGSFFGGASEGTGVEPGPQVRGFFMLYVKKVSVPSLNSASRGAQGS